jgi:hypothetical protein
MITLPPGLELNLPSIEVSSPRTVRSLMRRIRDLYEAIYTRYGLDGLELIQEVSRKHGVKIGKRARKNGPPWKIQEIGSYIIRMFDNINADGAVEEYSPHRIVIRVDYCPYPIESCAVCCAHTCMEQSLVEALNPEYEFTVEKSIPNGDAYCLHVIKPR